MQLVKLNRPKFMDEIKKASEGDVTSKKLIKQTLQAFLYEPKLAQRKIKEQIQAITVSTDIANLTAKAFDITLAEDNFDLGWERAFKLVQPGEYQLYWEIFDVQNSLTFVKVAEGNKIMVAGITGTKAIVEADYYGGALGFTDKMIRTRQIGAMVDNARIFRNKYWVSKADVYYALIAAAAALNQTAYNATATGQLRRDIATINLGINTLIDRCKDKGYGDTATISLVMFINRWDLSRIEAAFKAQTPEMSSTIVEANEIPKKNPIERIYTFNQFIQQGSPIICIPGNKAQRADAMAPTTYIGEKDPLSLNEYAAVWAIHGGAIGDTDQFQQINLS